MLKAARLTWASKLWGATAAIQRALSGKPRAEMPRQSAAAQAPDAMVIDAEVRVVVDVPTRAPTPAPVSVPKPEPMAELRPAPSVVAPPVVAAPEPQPSEAREAQFIAASFGNEAGRRDYKLYVPAGAHAAPLPLVVMLHGCTQDPDDFAAGTHMNECAEAAPCFVLYPAQAKSANASRCWNWFNNTDQQRDRGEPSIIAGMTREVIASHPIDPRRVYVAGLSAGGAMAATMASTYPELYAAVGVHSGLPHAAAHDMMSAFTAMRHGPKPKRAAQSVARSVVPTIVFHGDQDKTVHPGNGEQVIAQALEETSGSDGEVSVEQGQVPGGQAYTRTLHRDAQGQVNLEHWLVHGAGHAWSGGSAGGSFTDPQGPDASHHMLRFFAKHALRD